MNELTAIRNTRPAWLVAIAMISILSSGCAGTQSRHTDPQNDPWEGFNRKVHSLNMALDKSVARPVARVYYTVTPKPVQSGVRNFFRNIDYPVTFINQILQGKFRQSGINTGRFLINSTIGILGLFDIATSLGIPDYDEDFGQTLAKWGYLHSRYLVLPFFGPSTFRDGIGRSVYGYAHPVSWVAREDHFYTPMVVDLIQTRAAFLNQDETLSDAYDSYMLIRDAWLQNRTFKIYDGNPPQVDYDAYLDELDELDEID